MNSVIKIATLGGLLVVIASGFAMAQMSGGGEHGAKKFENLDTDGDGTISQSEFTGNATSRFDKADSNSDGVLSEDELAEQIMQRMAKRMARRMMKRLDYNNDGKVTKDEIESRSRKRFALMDANDDGKLDKDEMKRGSKRMGGMMGKHRGMGMMGHQGKKRTGDHGG